MRREVERDPDSFPQRDFDLIKEAFTCLCITTVVVLLFAVFWKVPYIPTVTNQQVAQHDPIEIEQTAVHALDGNGQMDTYGPPYNYGYHGNVSSVQAMGSFSPQTWWGTPYLVQPATADVMKPLTMLASASHDVALQNELNQYRSATFKQQQKWDANFESGLAKATDHAGAVALPQGDYGPVAGMMASELDLARSGILTGILGTENNDGVYAWNTQNNLLFLQGDMLHKVADTKDLSGDQWGINHDEGSVPGPWWLTPYTFLYQVPPWSTSAAGDEAVAYTVGLLFVLLLLVPWIPGLNKLPRALPVYRLIWRDWYRNYDTRH